MKDKGENYFASFARDELRGIKAYNAGTIEAPDIILSANENNFGVPPSVVRAMQEAALRANRYPDGSNAALREKISKRYGVRPENIITSNGLDGFFTMFGRAFLSRGDEAVVSECTFGVYGDVAAISGASVVKVPLREDYSQDPMAFADAVTDRTKAVFFCNPNNPTGTITPIKDIVSMLEKIDGTSLVVLDEAYIDFAADDVAQSFRLLCGFPNLIICRTFSKLYALAGVRVGFAAAVPAIIDYLNRVREPYCVTETAASGAMAALDEITRAREIRAVIEKERESISRTLDKYSIKYVPSAANFILILPGENYEALFEAFNKNKIAVRTFNIKGAPAFRLSVGTPEENGKVKEIISSVRK